MKFDTHYLGIIAIEPCRGCSGTGGVGEDIVCDRCGGNGESVLEVTWIATLARNLAVAGFGALMFRAGDNFGFHMGEDSSQCTCQWSPGRGVPYAGSTRCEQEELDDDAADEPDDCPHCDFGCSACDPLVDGGIQFPDEPEPPPRPLALKDTCIGCGLVMSPGELVRDYEEGPVHAGGCPGDRGSEGAS